MSRPYLWETEFENVHKLWYYQKPEISVNGTRFLCSEVYFHSQKPDPYNEAEWDSTREAVMEAAIRAKVRANASLAELLLAHAFVRGFGYTPLVSLDRSAARVVK